LNYFWRGISWWERYTGVRKADKIKGFSIVLIIGVSISKKYPELLGSFTHSFN